MGTTISYADTRPGDGKCVVRPRPRGTALVALGLAFLMAAGCTKPAPPPAITHDVPYVVGPPDRLSIVVLPDPIMSREVVVRPDGMITFDLIGDVLATGRTPSQIAEEIQKRISRYKRDARASVFVSSSQSLAITVFGEVRSPGVFPLGKNTRVAEAIGSRGGLTAFASKGRIRVIRSRGATPVIHTVNLTAIEKGDLTTNLFLVEGDIIVVPANALARVGFILQLILFPFQPLFGIVGFAGRSGL